MLVKRWAPLYSAAMSFRHRRSPIAALFALASWSMLSAASGSPSSAAEAAESLPPAVRAAQEFSAARFAEAGGDFRTALASYAEAVRLAPQEPFLRLEYGRLLARLGQAARSTDERTRRVALAVEQLRSAESLSNGNAEILRETGLLYLEIVDADPSALDSARHALEKARELRPRDVDILVPLGQIYRSQGQLDLAVEVFREATGARSGDGWVRSLFDRSLFDLAQARRAESRWAEAETLLRELLERDPRHVETRKALADVLSRRGAHRETAELLRGLAADVPQPEIRRRLVWELFMAGDLESASPLVDELIRSGDASAQSLRLLVIAAQGKSEESAELVAKMIADNPNDLSAPRTVAQALERIGRKVEAEQFLAALLQRLERGSSAAAATTVRVELASFFAASENWAKVEEVLRPLAERQGASRSAGEEGWRLLFAEALVRGGRGEEALSMLPEEEPSGSAIDWLPMKARRAEILLRLHRDAEAHNAIARLTADGSALSLLQAARIFQRLDRYEDALPWLERLLAGDPAAVGEKLWGDALYFYAVANERSGRLDKAVTVFRQLLERQPENALALNYLGYMWAERGENLDEALGLIKKAVALEPDNGAFADSLGWVHFRLGQLELARQALERAAQLLPRDSTVFEHLGDVYRALGETSRAKEHYERALTLEAPNTDELRRKLRETGANGQS